MRRNQGKHGKSLGKESRHLVRNISVPRECVSPSCRTKADYAYECVIGKGGFGKVYRVREKKCNQKWAMKEMSKAVILAKKSVDSVRNERELLTKLKHKLIVNMKYAFQDRDNLYMVMDLMVGGDLRYHICHKHTFIEDQIRFFAGCILQAIWYLHAQGVIHRDLKPQNLVFDEKGYIHVTDLGVARHLRTDNRLDTSGTPGYMAPQVMTRQNHSYEVDYFAVGVILYELMMGSRPYVGNSRKEIREQMLSRQAIISKRDIPQGWSLEAADFVNKLLQRRPMMRLGWNGEGEVRQHPWLKGFPWVELERETLQSPFKAFAQYNPQTVRYQATKENAEFDALINQNKVLLKDKIAQELFEGYSFEAPIKSQNHTSTSQFNRISFQNK